MAIKLKRAYDAPAHDDGARYLVERLWPRGVKKDQLRLSGWLKDIAPSTELRKWYGHEPERWPEFASRYRDELAAADKQTVLEQLAAEGRSKNVTLVFATKDAEHSGAAVLKDLIEARGS